MLMCFVFHYLITANIVRTRRFTDVKRVRLNGINIKYRIYPLIFLALTQSNSRTENRIEYLLFLNFIKKNITFS